MDFTVQSLATDKKGCIFSGTIFRILLNLASCCGFKEGIHFSLTVKMNYPRWRNRGNNCDIITQSPRCPPRPSAALKSLRKKNQTSSMLASSMPCISQHRRLTDSDNNSAFFRHFINDAESTNTYVTKAVFIDLCLVIQFTIFFFLPSGWNIKLEN